MEVVFEEKNNLPESYSKEEYESKGFFDQRIQDFSLRGKVVFLKVRRGRWRHKEVDNRLDPISTTAYFGSADFSGE